MNYVMILGNLVKEPEKVEKATKTMCKMVVAVNEKYTDSNGERITNFFNVITWGNLAENCLNYLKKGSKVAISGNLQNRTYETQNGEKRYITEIVAREVEFITKKEV